MTQIKMKNKEIKYISSEAITYGKSIVDLEFTLSDIANIKDIFQKVPELSEVLLSPGVDPMEKRQLIDRIFGLGLQANFIKLLLDKNRFNLLDEILQAAYEILQKRKSTVTAKLSYVTMPTDKQLAKMEEVLINQLGCSKIHWDFSEDPQLIGGFRLYANDLFFDYSLRGRLDEMKKIITGR